MKPIKSAQNQPSKDNDNEGLRAELKAAHNRFHGRYSTHDEVARHARWTPEELEGVQIEDEELYYDEILALFAARTKSIEREAQLSILRGFRRRDFVSGDFYEHAVIDRITKLT